MHQVHSGEGKVFQSGPHGLGNAGLGGHQDLETAKLGSPLHNEVHLRSGVRSPEVEPCAFLPEQLNQILKNKSFP